MKKYAPILTLTALTLATTLIPAHAAPPTTTPAAPHSAVAETTDRLIITFKPTNKTTQHDILNHTANTSDALPQADVIKESVATDPNTVVITTGKDMNPGDQAKAAQALEQNPSVQSVEPDRLVTATAAAPTAEPYYPRLWAFSPTYLNAPGAWNQGFTGAGQTVGIIDTGYANHPDLAAPVASYDFVSDASLSNDGNGRDGDARDMGNNSTSANSHGPFVQGEITARNNGVGTVGIAYDAQTVIARTLGSYGSGYVSDIADGITWAAGGTVTGVPTNPRPATVINASLAYPSNSCSSIMSRAINYAYSKNIPVVVAAGNDAANSTGYEPANCLGAIVVGASTSWGTMTAYSNWGSMLDVVAPGGTTGNDIFSTIHDGNTWVGNPSYGTKNGTSMAAPYVTGTIALMKQAYPSMRIEQIRSILTNTGNNVGGYAQIDTAAAVRAAKALAPQPAPAYALVPGSGIVAAYSRYGGVAVFGQPTSNEFSLVDGGVGQNFATSNRTIYWSPRTGAYPVWFSGGIGAKYRAGGYENTYGYPIMAETSIPNGAMQKFALADGRRTAFYWSPTAGTHTVWEAGAVGSKFTAAGGTGNWGFPTTDETEFWGGTKQTFIQPATGRQTVAYWSAATGAHMMNQGGDIWNTWANRGGVLGDGFPSTDESSLAGGGAEVKFTNNEKNTQTALVWSASTGTHSFNARGAFFAEWKKNIGKYGYPVTDETGTANGARMVFSNGYVFTWTPWGGTSINKS